MKTAGQFVAYLIIRTIHLPFYVLPYGWTLTLMRGFAMSLWPLGGRYHKIAYDNISHAYPEMSHADKLQLVKDCWKYLGNVAADALFIPRMSAKWLDKHVIMDPQTRALEQEILKSRQPTVVIGGHLGTFEVLAAYGGRAWEGHAIYKRIRNPFLDRWFKRIRETSGLTLLEMSDAPKAIKAIKKGYWTGFAADQNAGKDGVFVDFLNRPASTYMGPVLLAYITGARVLFVAPVHIPGNKIKVEFTDMGVIQKTDAPRKEVIHEWTQKWTKVLEGYIARYPEQYFWVHRRWKYTPEMAAHDEATGRRKI